MLGLDHGPSLLQASPNHASMPYSSHLALRIFAAQGFLFQPQIVSRLKYCIFLLLLCEPIGCKNFSSALLAYIYIYILRSYLFFLPFSLSLSDKYTHTQTHTQQTHSLRSSTHIQSLIPDTTSRNRHEVFHPLSNCCAPHLRSYRPSCSYSNIISCSSLKRSLASKAFSQVLVGRRKPLGGKRPTIALPNRWREGSR